jgi:hypothetical protein
MPGAKTSAYNYLAGDPRNPEIRSFFSDISSKRLKAAIVSGSNMDFGR